MNARQPMHRRSRCKRAYHLYAISTAKERKSISLEKRAEGTYAEYRRQKAERLRGARVPATSLLAHPNFLHFLSGS
jgi:hypothetical protein